MQLNQEGLEMGAEHRDAIARWLHAIGTNEMNESKLQLSWTIDY